MVLTNVKQLREHHDLYKKHSMEYDNSPGFLFLLARILNYYLWVICEQLFILNEQNSPINGRRDNANC